MKGEKRGMMERGNRKGGDRERNVWVRKRGNGAVWDEGGKKRKNKRKKGKYEMKRRCR